MIDLGRAERIAARADARFYRPPPPIPHVYSKRRIEALSVYIQATGLPAEFSRQPARHKTHRWIVCVPHAFTPQGVVYADIQTSREAHRERVEKVPGDKYLRCQAFMAVTGAQYCDYITVYRMSEDEARKQRGKSWGAHDRAWKWRSTFYKIHRVKRSEAIVAFLLQQAHEIKKRAEHAEEEEGRRGADQVRAELVPGRRQAGRTRKTYRTRRPEQGERALPERPVGRLGAARAPGAGEGADGGSLDVPEGTELHRSETGGTGGR